MGSPKIDPVLHLELSRWSASKSKQLVDVYGGSTHRTHVLPTLSHVPTPPLNVPSLLFQLVQKALNPCKSFVKLGSTLLDQSIMSGQFG